jgi:secreted trypsin-like serine protease
VSFHDIELTGAARRGFVARMKRWLYSFALMAIAAWPAHAMVGGARPAESGLGRSVITVVGSRGNFCSGALIAPDVVLTAAHCVPADATYKIVAYDAQRQPTLLDVRRIARHPQFNARGIANHRASADVALLQLSAPMPGKSPAPLGRPQQPSAVGARYSIAGIGVTQRGDGKSGGIVRTAMLIATGRPGTLQIRLVDPFTNNTREGLGACTGDSGGPVFEEQNGGNIIVGVIAWSTGANNASGCGGLTGVTPLTLYRDWIEHIVQGWRQG